MYYKTTDEITFLQSSSLSFNTEHLSPSIIEYDIQWDVQNVSLLIRVCVHIVDEALQLQYDITCILCMT